MPIKTELREFSQRHRETTGPYADDLEVDALVVGGGFGGIFCWYELKKAGFNTVIYEAGNDLGGTWRWNCYPGAGVDSEIPEYQLSIPETWKDWTWTTNYPTYKDLRAYFDHCDKVLGIKKETAFNSVVVDAQFHTKEGRWHVKTADGRTAKAKYFVVAAGFAAKRYVPTEFVGIDNFKGIVHHSSFWPDLNIDVKNKKCAVIGTGASGVQITQAWGPVAGELKVFQRTPNLAVPMRRRNLTPEEQNNGKQWYPELFRYRERCFGGFLYTFSEKETFEDTPEEREVFYQKLWDDGGFRFWLGNYKDYLYDMKANREAYNFWSKNVRARVGDPKLRDLLAPIEPPHPFGVKRPCLEYAYYEQFNRPNVDVIDIKDNPIVGFTEKGIKLKDGTEHEFDIICIATGFDITTGGMTSMGLKDIQGVTLKEQWQKAANTYLGTTISGYPNLFHLYGPHGPTLLSNGPTSVEVQGRWIVDAIKQIERQNLKYINPTAEATREWKKRINALSDISLFPTTRSTYMGGSMVGVDGGDGNGKVFEQTCYAGGLPRYAEEIRDKLPGFEGFEKVGK